MKTKVQETSFDLLWQVAELWRAEIRAELVEHNLSIKEFAILSSIDYLSKIKTEVKQIEIAAISQIKPTNVSILIRQLLKRKFLERKEQIVDTRAKIVQLTPEGVSIMMKISHEINELNNRFFDIPNNNVAEFTTQLKSIRNRRI
jgi:DNA-binding MarR family transcriptional regulator